MLRDLMSSPLKWSFLAIHEPVDPVTWTSGASGPKLPPDAIQSRDDKIIDGLFFGSSLPPLNLILLTISWISPGSPIYRIMSPANRPAKAITGITYTP